MKTYHFANILLSGACNLRCPYCIGHTASLQSMPDNLNEFPLKGLDDFITVVHRYGVSQISLTGVNTDPQLYRYEPELIEYLRQRIPGVKISLHTNGLLAIAKMDLFNLYDRATISLPSFDPQTCRKMTGRANVLDVARIIQGSHIPLKISTLITEHNMPEIPMILTRCQGLGIARIVLRKLYGETRDWNLFPSLEPIRYFAGNPVYDVQGMEVTVWDFFASFVHCVNLFSDGSISPEYQITRRKDDEKY